MKKSLIYLLLILVQFNILAQKNLIPNPGFEEYYDCDYNYLITPLDLVIEDWYPINKSPAYFNLECNDSSAIGIQDSAYFTFAPAIPHSGNGFLRMELLGTEAIFLDDTFNERTYAQVWLSKPLRPDRDYYLSYYITKTLSRYVNLSHYGVNFSDTFLSSSDQRYFQLYKHLNIKPQLEVDTVIDLYPGIWQKVSHCFEVDSVYNVMSIGVFAPQDSIRVKFDYSVPSGELPNLVSYDDFLLVEIEREVKLELERDTICVGECEDLTTNHTLIAGEFEWSLPGSQLGVSTDSAVTVCYDKPGSYDVGISIEHCTGTYSNYFPKAITVIPAIVTPLPEEVYICAGTDIELSIPDKYTVKWYDGTTERTHKFNRKGDYYYFISNGYCTDSFNITIKYYSDPTRQEANIYSCPNSTTTFLGREYTEPGFYHDTIRSILGCDSIYYDIDYRYYDLNPITLEGEYGFCEGQSTILKVISKYKELRWSNGFTANPVTINKEGTYFLMVKDENLCVQYDTVKIKKYPSPYVYTEDLLDKWYYKGIDLPVSYDGYITEYRWSNSHGLDCADCPYPKMIEFYEGVYPVRVINKYGCEDNGKVVVKFRRANIFLPNIIYNHSSNPLNNSFYLQSDIDLHYNMKIFNRWGNKVFETKDIHSNQYEEGWQPLGKVNPGVFVYVVEYLENEQKIVVSGDITVL